MSLKIDSIPILAGSNYLEWEQQIKHFLQSEDLFSHIEDDEINLNAPWPASYSPVPAENPLLLSAPSLEIDGKMMPTLCLLLNKELLKFNLAYFPLYLRLLLGITGIRFGNSIVVWTFMLNLLS